MQMNRFWMAALGVLVGAGALLIADEPKSPGDAKPVSSAAVGSDKANAVSAKIGQAAPDFTLLDCGGKKVTLAEYKDKLLVLAWVNQDCPWSVKSVPIYKDLYKKYADKGVVWLGVESTHFRKAEDNVQYIKDTGLPFTILMDTDGKVGHLYGAKTTPHVYVINKGKLIYMGAPHNDQYDKKPKAEFRNYLDEAVGAALAGKDAPVAETAPWGCSVKYKEVVKPLEKDKPEP